MTTDPVSTHDRMAHSLEIVGAAGIDIVPLFFARFYAAYPEERERFCNRASSEGLMVNEMLAMLLAHAAQEPWLATMMRAQVNTHHDHGDIRLEQYRIALDLLVGVLREVAGDGWNSDHDAAWAAQVAGLFAMIARFY